MPFNTISVAKACILPLAIVLAACTQSAPSTIPLPSDPVLAGEVCYMATTMVSVRKAKEANREISIDEVLDYSYFLLESVRAKYAPNDPTLDQLAEASNDESVRDRARPHIGSDINYTVAACNARYPVSDPGKRVALPNDEGAKAALCYYIARFTVPFTKGTELPSSATVARAEKVVQHIRTGQHLEVAARTFNVQNGDDATKLNHKMMVESLKYGTFRTIVLACPTS